MIQTSLEDALAPIGDGCMLVVPREVAGVPMAATRALIHWRVEAYLHRSVARAPPAGRRPQVVAPLGG